jgi:hypothetical protein
MTQRKTVQVLPVLSGSQLRRLPPVVNLRPRIHLHERKIVALLAATIVN